MGSIENVYHSFGALLLELRKGAVLELQRAISTKDLTEVNNWEKMNFRIKAMTYFPKQKE